MRRPCIVYVDDERRYRELLGIILRRTKYRLVVASGGLEGLDAVEREAPDLVLLDVKLPDLDGFEVCRRIRADSDVPIVMLTARAEATYIVRGLQLGADDYVTKPFGADELLARVDAILRRRHPLGVLTPPPFQCGDLIVDFARRHVTARGRDVQLTPGDYRLLEVLALNAGRVMAQDELLRHVWGHGYEGAVDLLYSTLRRLRRKLYECERSSRYICTRRGIGYSLAKCAYETPRGRGAEPAGSLAS
ncbi:MAG: response regulator transcription factor [Chloroflexi bacterium]|nr:response regulator transcription factor [Chloroflexota bacterium]